MTNAAINRTESSFMQQSLTKHVELQTAKYIVTNEPEYIKKAIDQINEHLPMRRLLGTSIELSVKRSDMDKLIQGFDSFEIRMKEESTAFDDYTPYFKGNISKFQISTLSTGLVIAANRTIVKDGKSLTRHLDSMLRINNCKIFDYDPESAVRNAEEAQARIEREGGSPFAPTVDLSFSNKITEHFFAKGAPSVSDFNSLQKSFRALQRVRSVNHQVTNLQTTGMAVHVDVDDVGDEVDGNPLDDFNLIKGYIILARKADSAQSRWYSLTKVSEEFQSHGVTIKAERPVQLGIGSGALVQSASESGNANKPDGITNPFFFTWDGTSIVFRSPFRQDEKPRIKNGDIDYSTLVNEYTLQQHDTSLEYFAITENRRSLFGIDWFPFMRYDTKQSKLSDPEKKKPPLYLLKRKYIPEEALKLKFGESYEFLAIAQYRNGFVPLENLLNAYNKNPLSTDRDVVAFANYAAKYKTRPERPSQQKFRRHDHIGDMILSLDKEIYQAATVDSINAPRTLRPEYLGESNSDLVIRTVKGETSDTCKRYILPPKVPNFALYLWYQRAMKGPAYLADRNLSQSEAYKWFVKYQNQKKNANLGANGDVDFDEMIVQEKIFGGRINYLPDPIVTGFMVRFFLDAERTVPANNGLGVHIRYPDTFCAYARGNYPQLKPWLFILKNDSDGDSDGSKIQINRSAQELTVRIRPGLTLFADIVPTFNSEASNFHSNIPFDKSHYIGTDPVTGLTFDSLYSNITGITLTHACKFPLFEPKIEELKITRYQKSYPERKEQNIKVSARVNFEHLNLWNGIPIPGISPTGEFELYALWNDYSNTKELPAKSIDEKKNKKRIDGGFIKIGSVIFAPDNRGISEPEMLSIASFAKKADRIDPQKHYVATVEFQSDDHFQVTHSTDVVFKLRETSKFTHFFPDGIDLTDNNNKEKFSLWSEEYELISNEGSSVVTVTKNEAGQEILEASANILFNNNKPRRPKIEKIVPVVVEDIDPKTKISVSGNRVRIYFKTEGMMATGKFERIGVIVRSNQGEPVSFYDQYFEKAELYSQCAADAVTDHPSANVPVMRKVQFVLTSGLFEKEYWDHFKPMYEPALPNAKAKNLGLVTYTAAFDEEQQLWYIEPEFRILGNGRPLHCAWVQLNLLTYNSLSPVYPVVNPTDNSIDSDYRISQPTRADFTYLYSERTILNPHLIFKKSSDSKMFTFSCHINSLFIRNGNLASQFIVNVERKMGDLWVPIDAGLKDYSVSRVARNYGVSSLQHFPLLPLDSDYDNRRNQMIEISFRLEHDSNASDIRIILIEIEYHHPSNGLAELHKLLEIPGLDFGQIDGVRIVNNIIIA